MTLVAGFVSGGTAIKPTGNKGTKGYTGDGGPATSAELNSNRGVAVDAAGNLYIADSANNVIRKVTASTGIISTVVGAYPGTNAAAPAGATGDGGPATQAFLSAPEDVEIDANGNLYILDFGNTKIRVVYGGGAQVASLIAATNSGAVAHVGYIYTILGGGTATYTPGSVTLGTTVLLGNPRKMAIDARGNVFVADNGNNAIVFMDGTTGYMRSIAGNYVTPVANGPGCPTQANTLGDNCYGPLSTLTPNAAMGVGVDSFGNVFISDSGNTRVREVFVNQNFPTVAFGSSASQILLVHFAAGDTPSSTTPFTVAGSTDFTISAPSCTTNPDTTTDCQVTVTFAPTQPGQDHASLIVTSTLGATSSFGLNGTGSAASVALDPGTTSIFGSGYSAPTGILQDAAGNIYIADTGNNRVVRYSGGTPTIIAGTGSAGYSGDGGQASLATLSGPKAVAVSPHGSFIADTDNVIRRVDPNTGIITTFGGGATSLCTAAIDSYGDGCLAIAAKFSAPAGLASDAIGNIYVADTGNSLIRELTPSGYVFLIGGGATTVCGSDVMGNGCAATKAIFKSPTALQVDANRNIFIADTGNNEVREIVSATNTVIAIAGTGQAGGSGNGGSATAAQVNGPTGIAIDAAGDVYIADTGNQVIRLVNASGTINTTAGTLGASGTGSLPDQHVGRVAQSARRHHSNNGRQVVRAGYRQQSRAQHRSQHHLLQLRTHQPDVLGPPGCSGNSTGSATSAGGRSFPPQQPQSLPLLEQARTAARRASVSQREQLLPQCTVLPGCSRRG